MMRVGVMGLRVGKPTCSNLLWDPALYFFLSLLFICCCYAVLLIIYIYSIIKERVERYEQVKCYSLIKFIEN
jgi:hypothetical protein